MKNDLPHHSSVRLHTAITTNGRNKRTGAVPVIGTRAVSTM